jgi:hypothetical protein
LKRAQEKGLISIKYYNPRAVLYKRGGQATTVSFSGKTTGYQA